MALLLRLFRKENIVLKTELHKTDLDIRGHSRSEKTTFLIAELIQYPNTVKSAFKMGSPLFRNHLSYAATWVP